MWDPMNLPEPPIAWTRRIFTTVPVRENISGQLIAAETVLFHHFHITKHSLSRMDLISLQQSLNPMNPPRINLKRRRRMSKIQWLHILLVISMAVQGTTAWSPNQKPFVSRRNHGVTPNTNTNSVTPKELTTQQMLKSSTMSTKRDSKVKLSNSVLASCDTLPSFPTAHGLLSPVIVDRLEASNGNNDAVEEFLRTYRYSGTLSCVHYLSDPSILPHLTRAMREIAA